MAGTEQGRGRRSLIRRRPAVAARPNASASGTSTLPSPRSDVPDPPSPRPDWSDLPDLPDWAPDRASLPLPRPALDEPLPEPEDPDLAFVCSVCRREIQLSERSRIAPSKCRACV
jgi:hypothetical protein